MMYKSASETTLKTSSFIINGTDNTNLPPCFSFYLLGEDESDGENIDQVTAPTVQITNFGELNCDNGDGLWETNVRKFKVTKQSILRELERERVQREIDLECEREHQCYLEMRREYIAAAKARLARLLLPDIGDTVENPVGIRTQAMKQAVRQNAFLRLYFKSSKIEREINHLVSHGGYGLGCPDGLYSLEDERDNLDYYEEQYMLEEKKLWHRYPDGSWYREVKSSDST